MLWGYSKWQQIEYKCHQIFSDGEVQTIGNLHFHVMCLKKHVFSQKNIYKWSKHGFATVRLSQKDNALNPWTDSWVKKKNKKTSGYSGQ